MSKSDTVITESAEVEATESESSNGKRTYNKRPKLEFSDVQIQALYRLLNRDPIHDAWREQLRDYVAQFLPYNVDFDKPPTS